MKKAICIGLMGLNFSSDNLGCAALAMSFYVELIKILRELDMKANIYVIGSKSDFCTNQAPEYPVTFQEYHLLDIRTLYRSFLGLKNCDIVFDFTEGDSFSDIYGRAVFYKSAILKALIEKTSTRLILGPQTYGPFEKKDCLKISSYIINHAFRIYSRDERSRTYLHEMGITKDIQTVTDVAFRLPCTRVAHLAEAKKINIGINISGLLWEDQQSGKNRLGLVTDYVAYSCQVVNALIRDPRYKIYLIPHAGMDLKEKGSDYAACYEMKQKYDQCVLLPGICDPIAVKSSLAQMDIVIAARMHASIGAFSCGVFTIPFAYSRKFQGYYSALNYPVMIDGKSEPTDIAVEKTLSYIRQYQNYIAQIQESHRLAQNKLHVFYEQIFSLLKSWKEC